MIKATVRYTSDHFLALDDAYVRKSRKKGIIRGAVIEGVVNLFYLWCIRDYVRYMREYGFLWEFIWLIAFVFVFDLFYIRLLRKKLGYRRTLAEKPPDDRLCSMEFSDSEFFMLAEKEGYRLTYRIAYPELVRADESGEFFLIGIVGGKTAVIRKNELTEGTPEELRKLLFDKLGDRFKIIQQ